jgi:hypothetical protein
MFDSKQTIFYFVRKIIKGFSEEEKEKINGISISVSDGMKIGRGGRELLGYFNRSSKNIVIFAPDKFILGDRDIYETMKNLEGLIRHELKHAIS